MSTLPRRIIIDARVRDPPPHSGTLPISCARCRARLPKMTCIAENLGRRVTCCTTLPATCCLASPSTPPLHHPPSSEPGGVIIQRQPTYGRIDVTLLRSRAELGTAASSGGSWGVRQFPPSYNGMGKAMLSVRQFPSPSHCVDSVMACPYGRRSESI